MDLHVLCALYYAPLCLLIFLPTRVCKLKLCVTTRIMAFVPIPNSELYGQEIDLRKYGNVNLYKLYFVEFFLSEYFSIDFFIDVQ